MRRRNKKAQSAGYAWIFGLVSLFGLGILYIVFSQVLYQNIVPVIKSQVNNTYCVEGVSCIDSATKAQIFTNIDKYMVYFNVIPVILFVVIIVYMIYASVRKEGDAEFR